MLKVESPCFIVLKNEGRILKLVPGKTIELEPGRCVIAVEATAVFEVGAEFALRAEWRNKFHQQFAKVVSIRSTDPLPVVEFELLGEPVNCESRQLYRVNVLLQEFKCTVGNERNCTLADVSVEGLSAIVKRPLEIGASVIVDMTVEPHHASGTMRAVSEKKLAGGLFRYGLIAPDKNSPLRKTLAAISSTMERGQLRRMAGAA